MKTVNVNIKRLHFTDFYTIGKLYVNGVYICDTIEDKVRLLRSKYDKVYGETAVMSGTYEADIYFSKKFGYKVIRLFGVLFFEGILIHKGNTQKDSLGCVIVGYNDKKGWVSRPTEALNKLIEALEGADKIIVTIE